MKLSRVMGRSALVLAAGLIGVQSTAVLARTTRVVVPQHTVVEAKLDEKLSSKTARVGQVFQATVAKDDRSGFPVGTEFEGVVTEVKKASKENPGVLNVKFRRVMLPDGRAVAFTGYLASLDEDDVRRTEKGRLEAKNKSKKFDFKWVAIGAGGGAVLSKVFGGDLLKGALIGALGGAAYSYIQKNKGSGFQNVTLDQGTEFGIQLANSVAFTDTGKFRYTTYNIPLQKHAAAAR